MSAVWYLALDIESTGPRYNNTVNSIGAYLAPADPASRGEHVKWRRSIQPMPGEEDDPVTMREFWANFPDVLKTIRAEARPAVEVMAEFRDFLHTKAEAGLGKIVILSDCPDYDAGRLDYLGQIITKTFTQPIRYMDVGRRHAIADPSERLAQLGDDAEAKFEAWLAKNAPAATKHTHLPDDDAQHLYYMMLFCDEQRRRK